MLLQYYRIPATFESTQMKGIVVRSPEGSTMAYGSILILNYFENDESLNRNATTVPQSHSPVVSVMAPGNILILSYFENDESLTWRIYNCGTAGSQ